MKLNLQLLKNTSPHFPVLIQEVLANLELNPKEPQCFLDCTFGAGGYSRHILESSHKNTKVIAIDRDETVIPIAEELQKQYPKRFQFYLNTYANYPQVLQEAGVDKVDGIIMDLGFSSMQINATSRGFSFKEKGELLMTMGLNKTTAYEFVNYATEELIADVIYYYGEEHKARQIAKKIVQFRKEQLINTPEELADIVRSVVGFKGKNKATSNKNLIGKRKIIDPATKTFQAIRIYINEELQELTTALNNASNYLKPAGKLLVVSFHSLEDRIVKDFLNTNGFHLKKYANKNDSLEKFTKNKLNLGTNNNKKLFEIITKKPIIPSKEEVAINPPSASAKLRVARKI